VGIPFWGGDARWTQLRYHAIFSGVKPWFRALPLASRAKLWRYSAEHSKHISPWGSAMPAPRPVPAGAREQVHRLRSKDPRSGPSRSRHTRDDGPRYQPGDPIKETGIYEVIHDRDHRTAHEAVMLANDKFPACDTCFERVRFRLVRTAPYIFDDADFES
jgi:hypothetical protein